MGRMLAELGEMSARAVQNNQRQSDKIGKGSFAYAWAFDMLPEERARCVVCRSWKTRFKLITNMP